jgi:LmbE family N-acetylglucosaminyl deacetylase
MNDPAATAAPRGLLAIFAHPDDESYGAGGVLALAAAAGNPVWVLCVTNGDQGGRPGETGVDHSLDPEIRREELRCACRELGISEPIFLGYRDSGMEGWGAAEGSLSLADPAEVVERMLTVIRRLRPAVVVTFDPGGVYGHPDHVACSATATAAYRRAAAEAGGPVALYHQALPRSRVAAMRAAMEEERLRSGESATPSEDDLRQQEAFERLARPDEDITTIVRIGSVLERKVAALACHDSQMRGRRWEDPETRAQLEAMFGEETFVRVDPAPQPDEAEGRFMALEWGER